MNWFAKWWQKPDWEQNVAETILHVWFTITALIVGIAILGLPLWVFLYASLRLIWGQ